MFDLDSSSLGSRKRYEENWRSCVSLCRLFGGPYENNRYLGTLFQLDKDIDIAYVSYAACHSIGIGVLGALEDSGTNAVTVQPGDTAVGDTLSDAQITSSSEVFVFRCMTLRLECRSRRSSLAGVLVRCRELSFPGFAPKQPDKKKQRTLHKTQSKAFSQLSRSWNFRPQPKPLDFPQTSTLTIFDWKQKLHLDRKFMDIL